jgi:hypothetical protein
VAVLRLPGWTALAEPCGVNTFEDVKTQVYASSSRLYYKVANDNEFLYLSS